MLSLGESDNLKIMNSIKLVAKMKYSKSLNNVIVFENDIYVLNIFELFIKFSNNIF